MKTFDDRPGLGFFHQKSIVHHIIIEIALVILALMSSVSSWPVAGQPPSLTAGQTIELQSATAGRPYFYLQPTNQTTARGLAARFQAVARGGEPMTYQWWFNFNPLPGATSPELVLPQVSDAQDGAYILLVSNALGHAWSDAVNLHVVPVAGWGLSSNGLANVPPIIRDVIGIAMSRTYALALHVDGTVAAWGGTSYGQIFAPYILPITNVVAIAGGDNHILLLRSDGMVMGMGDVSFGKAQPPAGLSNVVAISAGLNHSLAIKANGKVVAWGQSNYGVTNVPDGLSNVVAVAAGSDHSAALKGDGTLAVWGNIPASVQSAAAKFTNVLAIAGNHSGGESLVLMNDGTVVRLRYPTMTIPFLSNIVAVAAGYQGMALKNDGAVITWNFGGSLLTNVPPGLTNVMAIAATGVPIGTSSGGTVYLALVGVGRPVVTAPPVGGTFPLGNRVELKAKVSGITPLKLQWQFNGQDLPGETNTSLALTNLQMEQAGGYRLTASNALGTTTTIEAILRVVKAPPSVLTQPVNLQLLRGTNAQMSVQVEGSPPFTYQWLLNNQPVEGATGPVLELTHVTSANQGGYSVAVSNAFGTTVSSAAVAEIQYVVAWGDRTYGQVQVPSRIFDTASISAGGGHVLLLTTNQTLRTWGENDHNQCTVPGYRTNVVAASAGGYHSLALLDDGEVLAWGDNFYGQIKPPDDLRNVVAIDAGENHNLALTAEGTVAAWGFNNIGQAEVPEGLVNIVAVAAGTTHSQTLKADGTVTGWGWNVWGQNATPPGLNKVIAIDAGKNHTIALKADGTVACWGANHYGQTNVPSGLSHVVAIAAGWDHCLALKDDGNLVAWGRNANDYGTTTGQTNIPPYLKDVAGISAGGNFNVALLGDGSPNITVQPASHMAVLGAATALHVMASGDRPLYYQWRCDGRDLPGQTNATLVLNPVQLADAGSYEVSVANALGRVVSRPALLRVLSPMTLHGPIRVNGKTGILLPSTLGQNYQLEYKNQLQADPWKTLITFSGTDDILMLADPEAPVAQRFYRVKQVE